MKSLATAVALMLMVAGCGLPGETTDTTVAGPTTTSVAPAGSSTTASPPPAADDKASMDAVDAPLPEAIISLSPTATEMLFAIGAGDRVIAVDEYSTFPADAPVTDLSGFTPNIEAIIAYEPDLVIVSNDIDDIVASLAALEIPVVVMPAVASISEAFDQIDEIGLLTGHASEAAELVEGLTTDLEALIAGLPQLDEPLSYYHELDPTFYSVTSSTFIGHVYSLLGLENIADPADADGFGYPQLSVEYIVASDPDLIFVTDCCGESLETISSRPGWENISAVQTGSVVVVNDDVASRWGPRTVEFLRTVAQAVAALEG